jgi:glycosyltransferase involved in cell wall biosynthesis
VRLAYFTNQYPAVSHTFIRREIRALERLGLSVERYALREGQDLVDAEDLAEAGRTRYIVKAGMLQLMRNLLVAIIRHPLLMGRIATLAVRIGWGSRRGILLNLIYAAEATVLASWCRRDGVEHIHAHFGTNAATVAMLAGCLSGIPYSFTSHGPDEYEEYEALELKIQDAAFVICVSRYGQSQLFRRSAPDHWPKIRLVHCGVDDRFLGADTSAPSARRFVNIARLSPEKGQLVLIAAARQLHDEGLDFELVLGGGGYMRPLLEQAIREAGLEGKVILRGWVTGEQVRTEIENARALVVPSFAENLPVAIMEALALRRPVISTCIAGIPELVEPKVTGWLVPPADADALADAMRDALATPVEELDVMGANGRRRTSEQFNSLVEATKLREMFLAEYATNASAITAVNPDPGTAPVA